MCDSTFVYVFYLVAFVNWYTFPAVSKQLIHYNPIGMVSLIITSISFELKFSSLKSIFTIVQ
jgi:hypothetical protein